MTPATLLSLALRLAPAETPEHLAVVAEAISSAATAATCQGPYRAVDWCRPVWSGSRSDLAALLLVLGVRESALSARIARNECRPAECDHGQARGVWQTHQSAYVPDGWWDAMVGDDYLALTTQALVAARVLGAGLRWCRTIEGAVSVYARGACKWRGAPERVAAWERVR